MNFIYPVSRYLKITQVFHSGHLGLDFGWNDGPYDGQPIVAIEDGAVVGCADGYGNTYPSQKIYGNYVNIKHGDNFWSMYGHLRKGITVKLGQKVKKGDIVGYMGNTGYSKGQHLHFELRIGSNSKSSSRDPMTYLYVEDKNIYVNPDSLWYDRIQYKNPSPVTPVERNSHVAQIEVALDILNCRDGASIKANKLGFVARGYYNVYNIRIADGYTWYEIENGKWCAQVTGVTYYAPQSVTMYSVLFPAVTRGDKEYLVHVGDELNLAYEVKENK